MFKEINILIQQIIAIFSEMIILIQRIIYIFNEIISLIQRYKNCFHSNNYLYIELTIYVLNGELTFFYMFNDSEFFSKIQG